MNVSDKPALIGHEGRVVLLALLAGLPGSAVALWLLWTADDSTAKVQWTLTVLIVGAWLGFAPGGARARGVPAADALQSAGGAARGRFLGARPRRPRPTTRWAKSCARSIRWAARCASSASARMEATTLLRTVMAEIDVAIFAFDETPAAAPGESRRRAAAGRSRRAAAGPDRGANCSWTCAWTAPR